MWYLGPDDEHAELSPYERRQFEQIKQSLAQEDPRAPKDERQAERVRRRTVPWERLTVAGAALAVLGVLIGSPIVCLLGSVVAVLSVVMYLHRRLTDQVS